MRFAGTTLIRPTAEEGLQRVSVALVFQLRAMDRARKCRDLERDV